jgi:hypothetical protein
MRLLLTGRIKMPARLQLKANRCLALTNTVRTFYRPLKVMFHRGILALSDFAPAQKHSDEDAEDGSHCHSR